MKDLNKLQKWAKVIFVITVFFFLGYTLYWIVFMLSIANYSSANVIGSDYVVMSIYLTCFDIVGSLPPPCSAPSGRRRPRF